MRDFSYSTCQLISKKPTARLQLQYCEIIYCNFLLLKAFISICDIGANILSNTKRTEVNKHFSSSLGLQ